MDKKKVIETALDIVIAANPIIGPVLGIVVEAGRNTEKALQSSTGEELEKEVSKQQISLRMAELQARVAQEAAIAYRIENAEEVEIEEYYEGSGEGTAGLRNDATGTTLGLGASGRKVTKRIYRFTGKRMNSSEVTEAEVTEG